MGQSDDGLGPEQWPPLWLATLVAVVVSVLAAFVMLT